MNLLGDAYQNKIKYFDDSIIYSYKISNLGYSYNK